MQAVKEYLGSGRAIKHLSTASWPTAANLIESQPFSRYSTTGTGTSSSAVRPSAPTPTSCAPKQNRCPIAEERGRFVWSTLRRFETSMPSSTR